MEAKANIMTNWVKSASIASLYVILAIDCSKSLKKKLTITVVLARISVLSAHSAKGVILINHPIVHGKVRDPN